jgi:hypothetical protein
MSITGATITSSGTPAGEHVDKLISSAALVTAKTNSRDLRVTNDRKAAFVAIDVGGKRLVELVPQPVD